MKKKMASSSPSSSSCIDDQPLKPRNRKNKKKRQSSSSTETRVCRTSVFRGVTRHRLSGKFEAHLWDKNSDMMNKKKKGKQVYLGAYDDEEAAGLTYDLAAIKYWGLNTTLNFEVNTYKDDMEEMKKMTNEEYIAFLRRKSSGFSRGVSKYRGVARHHHNGRWEARIGRVNGNKYIYLGTYATEEEAAKAYDLAAIKFRGTNTVTNFDISNYSENMDAPDDSPPSKDELNDDMKPKPQEDELNDDMKPKPQEDEGQLSEIQNLKFEQDNPWSLSMELGYSYTPHVFSDDPFDKSGDHLDLFNDHGFEANIDSIFSKPVSNNGCATSTSSPLFSSSPRMSFGA